MLGVAGLSVIIYFLAGIIMFYYKKKAKKQDTPVFIISLPPPDTMDDSESRGDSTAKFQRTNAATYNPIIFQLESLAYFALAMIVTMVLMALGSLSINNPHYIFDYLQAFTPGLLFYIVIPLIFYARNTKARKFVISLFVRR